jgi:hypothetical protein
MVHIPKWKFWDVTPYSHTHMLLLSILTYYYDKKDSVKYYRPLDL